MWNRFDTKESFKMDSLKFLKALFVLAIFSICRGNSKNSFLKNFGWNFFNFLVTGSEDEERLVRDLFRGYNKLIRPVQNMTQKVDVRFGLAFVQLINVVSANFAFFLAGSNFHKRFSTFPERKESDYEIKCLAAVSVERLPTAVGWGWLWWYRGIAIASRQGLEGNGTFSFGLLTQSWPN